MYCLREIQGRIDDPWNVVKYFLSCIDNVVMVRIHFLLIR